MEGMGMNPEFWKGKKVLVTGHTGFKGSWLSLWLQNAGAHVIGYSLQPTSEPSLFTSLNIADSMHSIIGDIRDRENLQSVFIEHRPEIVFHMAAQALVRYSYNNPVETYSTNVMGVVNVFEAVRASDCVRVVVNITSDKCYENKEWLWGYREDEPMGGYDPYSSSKGCAEIITSAYRKSYFNPGDYAKHNTGIASARAGNVIGGGDWAEDRLIPDMIRAATTGSSVKIRNPDAIRPWQHVLEPLNGYLTLAEKLWEHGPEYVGGWNFGPSETSARPVSWVMDRLMENWGDGMKWIGDETDQPHESRYLKLDCSKARTLLGWEPKLDLETSLRMTVEWYREFYESNGQARQLIDDQIINYQKI